MFKVGEYVVNANNGLGVVMDIRHLDISVADKSKLYYIIVPLEEKSAKLYIPVDGSGHGIRKVIDEKQAWEIIDKIPEIEEIWIDNDKQREQKYKEAVLSCKPEVLVSVIKSMYHRRQKRTAQGKKNTTVDERYFKLAESHLYSELAFAIGKDKDEMQQLITERVETNGKKPE